MSSGFNPPLQVTHFVATRSGDSQRGPAIRMRAAEAGLRMLQDGELVWVYGPRRQELATLTVDDAVPRGCVEVRDLSGISVTEIVRVMKPDLDRAARRGHFA